MELPKLSQPPDNVDPKTRIPEFKNFLAELETLRRVLTDAETKLVSITQKCKIYFEGYSYACDLHLMLVDGLKTINDGVYEVEEKFHANYDAETGEKKRQVEARTEDDDAVFQLLLSPQATMKSEEQDEPAENLAPPTEETSEHQFIPEASTVPAESYEPSSPRTEEESCSDWDPDDEVPPPNYQEDYNSEDNQVENSDSQPQQHPPVPPIKISNLLKRRASQSLQRKIKKSQKQHEQKIASAPRNFAARSSSEPPIIISPLTPPPLIKRKRGRPRSIFPNQTIPWGGPIPVPGPPRKRGRPRKIPLPISSPSVISLPKKRGRPRKIRPLETEQIITTPTEEPPRRKRGRPRKILPSPPIPSEQIICSPEILPPPKKRGRPRKHPLPIATLKISPPPSPTFSSSPPTPSPPLTPPPTKRGRGRPRKIRKTPPTLISKAPVTCPICEKVLAYNGLPLHTQRCHTIQSLDFKCSLCPRAFPTKGQLKNHFKIHSDVKNFICEICGWSFHLNSNLQQHMRKHRDERPFKCTQCDATFKFSQSCKLHMVAIHSDKSNQCTLCGKMFSTLTKLKSHDQSVHQSIRKFACSVCGKGFKRGHHLKYHEKTHTNPTAKPRGLNRGKSADFGNVQENRVAGEHVQENHVEDNHVPDNGHGMQEQGEFIATQ